MIKNQVICYYCNGTGIIDQIFKCPLCNGKGHIPFIKTVCAVHIGMAMWTSGNIKIICMQSDKDENKYSNLFREM